MTYNFFLYMADTGVIIWAIPGAPLNMTWREDAECLWHDAKISGIKWKTGSPEVDHVKPFYDEAGVTMADWEPFKYKYNETTDEVELA